MFLVPFTMPWVSLQAGRPPRKRWGCPGAGQGLTWGLRHSGPQVPPVRWGFVAWAHLPAPTREQGQKSMEYPTLRGHRELRLTGRQGCHRGGDQALEAEGTEGAAQKAAGEGQELEQGTQSTVAEGSQHQALGLGTALGLEGGLTWDGVGVGAEG